MASTEIWTFQDAVEHLADFYDAKRSKEMLRQMRRSVLRAYRDLPNLTRWSYYDRRYILKTTPSLSTGSISYDHDTLALTLTGDTWPEDAAFGRVKLGNVVYEVESRESDTKLALSPNSNPGEDATFSSFTWFRDTYPLPTDFKKLHSIHDTDREEELVQVGIDQQKHQSIYIFDSPDTPWTVTVGAAGDFYGTLHLIFSPPPSGEVLYDVLYEASPRPLLIEKYTTGTVSISAGSTTLTGTGTTFPENCEGSIIRLSSDGTTAPTSVVGDYDGNDNPFTAQRVILDRTSGTSLVLDATVGTNLSGVKYTISDPIDIEAKSMWSAFLRMAEFEYARIRDLKNTKSAEQEMYRAISLAREADQRMPNLQNPRFYDPFRRPRITQG